MTPSNDRFRELRELLDSYTVTGYAFDDTEDRRGVALSAYLRQAARDPARAAEAAAEIDDLLETGLFSDEIADDVDLLPHINPPRGETVESCLAVIGGHLRQFLAEPANPSQSPPHTAWEWRERFPGLQHLLAAYFHQDSSLEYSSYGEALDDYVSGASESDLRQLADEIREFLILNESDQLLKKSAVTLGLAILPPRGVRLRQWLTDVRGIALQGTAPRSGSGWGVQATRGGFGPS
ncbi:contact-dependent growth inhibition system immunity protein [Streptomyces goshikiensis]|uniref:contact-dependent growth inhibition system immunity protein n=1 Tax=Streptomyces goshikiensis TaxID=1942 RepID=UPI0036BE5485